MIEISNRILEMQESATLAMTAKSRAMKAKGIDVINLSIGEPDFHTPKHIMEAAKQGIEDGYHHYPPVPGYMDLREAISQKFKRDNNLDYKPEQIVTSTGAKHTLANLIFSLINPGDECILPAPYWVSYEGQIELAGGKTIGIETTIENDFKITANQLEAAITPKTKILLFSSPCNPTGSVYSKEELESLAKVLEKHSKIVVISDEIYELINYTGKHCSIGTIESLKDRTVTVNGLSKGFAMTGWRLGYMGAPLEIAKACVKFQGQFTSATSGITQRAAIEAVSSSYETSYKMRDEFLKRRDIVAELLREIPGFKVNIPDGAFYFFPDVSALYGKSYAEGKIENNSDLAFYLLEKANVACVTGAAFGNKNCIRLSYASNIETLREAISRIKTAVEKLS